jgi:uncharacterized protein (TIGR00730 family)
MEQVICVYCSSSDAVDSVYADAARTLGAQIARRGWKLIYGGSNIGLMGIAARTAHENGGQVIGVIPEVLHAAGLAYDGADELIVTGDLRERKAIMEAQADAFVTLPGGFGTLEEALEILTLKQLGFHARPVVFLNVNGFFDLLLALFERLFDERFSKPAFRQLYHVAPDVENALDYIETYHPPRLERKWF